MQKQEKENAIESVKDSISEANKSLLVLTKTRKEAVAETKERERSLNEAIIRDVGRLRETERNKRLQTYGNQERKKQEITSALMLEFLQICQEHDVPVYIHSIAKILDNFQGMCYFFLAFFLH